jgi:NADP-dependent 3-hydroxy acid dehydrogenase YdfG
MTLPAECEWESVSGKAIIVSGGTTGIGRTTAKMLASLGARVLIYGRHEKELREALDDIKAVGEVYGLTADQAHPEDVRRVFQEADARLGRVDVLINNAGEAAQSILSSDYAEWHYVIQNDLLGYMACARHAIERMEKQGGGHIVNVGSLSAKARNAESNVYVAAKSGIEGFTDALAKEVGEKNIRVTTIEPGKVGADFPNSTPEEQPKQQAEGVMLKSQDIAAAIFFTLIQPARCDVALMQIRPIRQAI